MQHSLLAKYGRRPHEAGEDGSQDGLASASDLGSFGVLRGQRERAVMLELIKKDGTAMAIGYAWLERILFDPAGSITLRAAGDQIVIRGRNLNGQDQPPLGLYSSLTRHRVVWIREADRSAALSAEDATTLVEQIVW